MTKIIRINTAVLLNYLCFFCLFAVVFFYRADVGAASAEDAGIYFSKGEAQLADIYNPGVRDSRQNWLNCAGNFKKAYDCEPDGEK